jgi:predicted alpha-1,2-mannosidase
MRLALMLTLVTVSLAGCSGTSPAPAPAPSRAAADLTKYVDTFAGTSGEGYTFPGPVAPFGMMQWGPDTSSKPPSGYSYDDTTIGGFSLQHLNGAGCPGFGDVPFLPVARAITISPAAAQGQGLNDSFAATFSHAHEQAEPGYYRVALNPGTPAQIDAQLTVSTRAGIGSFRFPASSPATVLVNATGSPAGNDAAALTIDPKSSEVTGTASSGRWCAQHNHYRVYFAARFSRPFRAYGTWTGANLATGSTSAQEATPGSLVPSTGAYLNFDTSADQVVEVRTAISYVSVANARNNLATEIGNRSFSSVRVQVHKAWNDALRKIEVSGGSRADETTFYSMLYRTMIQPNVFSDVDGRYIGMDGRVHRATGRVQYANFSGWDVYRSQMPLMAMLAPNVASDVAASLIADQHESGWLPKWSVANGQTNVMTGDSADPTLASIWALGAHGFDLGQALAAATKGANQSGSSPNGSYVERPAGADFRQLGYVPQEKNALSTQMIGSQAVYNAGKEWGAVSTTLEYSVDDFAIARLAAAAGNDNACQTFLRRSGNWRNVFDPSIGYVRPRLADGSFVSPYDPDLSDFNVTQGIVEGTGAQYTWMVPQDPAGLISALGGPSTATARLDRLFSTLNEDETGTAKLSSPYAWLGDEPGANAPWLYDWMGAPSHTQAVIRRAVTTLFGAKPKGYPGNDDLGQMSAWYVFGAIGLYPEIPGSDVLALASPLFASTTLHLAQGDVKIEAPAAAPDAPVRARLDRRRQTSRTPVAAAH